MSFSARVDKIIEEEALQKYLQIKTESRNPDGWFDYTFSDIELTLHNVVYSKKGKRSFSSFVDYALEILWSRT